MLVSPTLSRRRLDFKSQRLFVTLYDSEGEDTKPLLDLTHREPFDGSRYILKVCCIFPQIFLCYTCCTKTLPPFPFVYPRQLPPSHPVAPPEHLKEPLAYMRKAQVSLSALISVTPASTTNPTLCSFLQFESCCFFQRLCIGIIWSPLFPVFVLSCTGQLGEARPQKPEQHEQWAWRASGSHGTSKPVNHTCRANSPSFFFACLDKLFSTFVNVLLPWLNLKATESELSCVERDFAVFA